MSFVYLVTPFIAWLVAGSLKFVINSINSRKLAVAQIGYGGMPSNHSAIVSSAVTQVAIQEGLESPAFGIGIALAFIVMLDASSLRRQIGSHATTLNKLSGDSTKLRERVGHTRSEIFAGIATGLITATIVSRVLST